MNCPNCDSNASIEVEYWNMITGKMDKTNMCLNCTFEWRPGLDG